MTRLLFLSYCMPPLKYPRSVQISRLIKYLPVKPDVIYADEPGQGDPSIAPNFEKQVGWVKRIPFHPFGRIGGAIRRTFLPWVYRTPDMQSAWSKKLARHALTYLQENSPQIVVTFGQPMSVHLAGLTVKKNHPDIPWVAHFSDPWVANPLNPMGAITRWMNRRLERQVMQQADKIMFTSQETLQLVAKDYSDAITQKFSYLPHAYDRELYLEVEKPSNACFTLRYVGGFYSQRTPEPLLEAIRLINLQNPKLLMNVRFEIVGDLGRHSYLKDRYKELAETVVFAPSVSYSESLRLMQAADILLVIDAPSGGESVFFPSKLVDYIGSQRPIYGITPEGTSRHIIESLGGTCADPRDIPSIQSLIEEVLKSRHGYDPQAHSNAYQQYDAQEVAKRFMTLLKEVE